MKNDIIQIPFHPFKSVLKKVAQTELHFDL